LGDEAFYAGDRAHVGILKTIITEPTLTIEGKFRDAVLSPNFLHVMLTANAERPRSRRAGFWCSMPHPDMSAITLQ
jgi:hypothetical protein